MFDKKLGYTLAAIAAVSMIALGVASVPDAGDIAQMHEPVSDVEVREETTEEEKEPEVQTGYVMRELGGRIAVYAEEEEEPFMVLDTMVKFLPDYDRALLNAGIHVKDAEELAALIEDYIS